MPSSARPPADWTVVADQQPTRIVFDTPGEDVFTGVYLGRETVEATEENGLDESFDVLVFRSSDDNELYSTAPGFKLDQAFRNIAEGTECRIEYIKDIPATKPDRDPMKDFRVSTR